MIHAPGPRRERILGYGPEGSGKSSMWVSIAEWIYKTKSPAKVRVIDTDTAWDAMRPTDGHLDDIVIPFPIYEWSDYKTGIETIRRDGKPDDWFVIDLTNRVWDDAQRAYTELVFGKQVDEFYLEVKMKNERAGQIVETVGGDYGTNWQHIKTMYESVMGPIHRYRGHVLCCAAADVVKNNPKGGAAFNDTAEIIGRYGRIGYKPAGEKRIGHLFHTTLFLADTQKGFRVTTAKDRGERPYVAGKEVTPDFVVAYLVAVGGWKP